MSDEPKREAQKSAPIEITIRLDPSSVVSAGKAAAEAARDTAKSISEAIVAARGPIIVVLSLALAVGVAGMTGSGKPLGIVVAGWIVYGATRLKAAFFPLSPDDEP